MKGIFILTEGRSGSNWLGSLMKNTGVMGKPDEWLDPGILGSKPGSAGDLVDAVLARASTENGRFAVKLFPRHLRLVQMEYGIDFVRECSRHHDIGMVRLSRADRMRQAISYARGLMTSQWTSQSKAKGKAEYSFKTISEAYFYIDRSEAFWDSYVAMSEKPAKRFVYEELMGNPLPFIKESAEILDVDFDHELKSELEIQRDASTEEWLQRFSEDLKTSSPLPYSNGRPASRTIHNLRRFFRRQPLSPF